jgi:uncharacterized protein DUF5678
LPGATLVRRGDGSLVARRKLFVAVDFSKYQGRYVALVDNRVVATGKDAKTVWMRANKKKPTAIPTLVKVPKGETLVLIPCA